VERRHEIVPDAAAPEIATLLGFWRQIARADIPTRDVMEPFTLRSWLGHLSVYEAIEGGRDFRIRLDGTAIVDLTGEDWTGRLASGVDTRYGSTLVSAMQDVLASGQPAIHTMKVYQNGLKDITRLLLPVKTRLGGAPDQIFLAIYFDPPRELS
jgi:hypothetical protein